MRSSVLRDDLDQCALPLFKRRPQAGDISGRPTTVLATGGSSISRPSAGKSGVASMTTTARPPAPTTEAKARRKPPSESAAGSGAVLLSISPWGQVEVNGQNAGTTPPLSRLSLPAGRHTITVRNEDLPIYTTTVLVQADKTVLVRHRFVQ